MKKARARMNRPPKIYPSAVVLPGAVIGNDAVVGAFCFVADGAKIGEGSRLQSHTSVWSGVTLLEDVFVGPAAMFTNVRRPRAAFPRAPHWEETVVGRGASIGAHATLVCPVRIGAHAMIGAGAVVTRDVPPHAVVYGVPARLRGWACTCGEPLTRSAPRPASSVCRACGRRFSHGEEKGLGETTERDRRSPSTSRASPCARTR